MDENQTIQRLSERDREMLKKSLEGINRRYPTEEELQRTESEDEVKRKSDMEALNRATRETIASMNRRLPPMEDSDPSEESEGDDSLDDELDNVAVFEAPQREMLGSIDTIKQFVEMNFDNTHAVNRQLLEMLEGLKYRTLLACLKAEHDHDLSADDV